MSVSLPVLSFSSPPSKGGLSLPSYGSIESSDASFELTTDYWMCRATPGWSEALLVEHSEVRERYGERRFPKRIDMAFSETDLGEKAALLGRGRIDGGRGFNNRSQGFHRALRLPSTTPVFNGLHLLVILSRQRSRVRAPSSPPSYR